MMRYTLLIIITFSFCTLTAFGTDTDIRCGYDRSIKEFEAMYGPELIDNNIPKDESLVQSADKLYVIPVVFHVFHNDGEQSIPVSQVQSALDRVNREIRGLNDDFNTVDPFFENVKGTLNVTFALATIDPDGNPTIGVNYYPALSGFGNGNGYDQQIQEYAWNNYMYMNIYIMLDLYNDGVQNNSGVAWYPNKWMSDNNLARVVYNHRYLGDHGTSIADENFQSVFTHEVGHWLNLKHTFQGGCSEPNDEVDDTPSTEQSAGCSPGTQSCGHVVNGENYMEYTQCYKMFTQGQVERMRNALENHPARITLWQPDNLIATGTIHHYDTEELEANFEMTYSEVEQGQTVYFFDKSKGFPDEWRWSFPGADPESSTEQNPYCTFNSTGEYTVSLTVSKDGEESELIQKQITVSENKYDCLISFDFEDQDVGEFPQNWSDNGLPDGQSWTIETIVDHPWAEVDNFTSYPYKSLKALTTGENWEGNGPIEKIIISPEIDLTYIANPKLNYYDLRAWDPAYPTEKLEHIIEIVASENNDGPWSTISEATTSSSQFHDWISVTDIDLSDYEGKKFYLGFRCSTHVYYWRIDDICITGDDVSSVNDLTNSDMITIKPNPANDIVEILSENEQIKQISLISCEGIEVMNKDAGKSNSIELNIGQIPSGIYFLRVVTPSGTFVEQLLVVK